MTLSASLTRLYARLSDGQATKSPSGAKHERPKRQEMSVQTRQRSDVLIEELAQRITRLGLEAPALLLLEAHRPLAFLAGQALLVAQPLLTPLVDAQVVQGYADLLAEPEALDRLAQRLEAGAGRADQ